MCFVLTDTFQDLNKCLVKFYPFRQIMCDIRSSWIRSEYFSESGSCPLGSHIWSYWPRFIWQVDKRLESLRKLLKITHLASRKSYLILFLPKFISSEKFTTVKLYHIGSVRTLLKITRLASRKSCLVIIIPSSHKKLSKRCCPRVLFRLLIGWLHRNTCFNQNVQIQLCH